MAPKAVASVGMRYGTVAVVLNDDDGMPRGCLGIVRVCEPLKLPGLLVLLPGVLSLSTLRSDRCIRPPQASGLRRPCMALARFDVHRAHRLHHPQRALRYQNFHLMSVSRPMRS